MIIDLRDVKYTPIVSETLTIANYIIHCKQYFKGKVAMIASKELLYSMFKLSTLFTSQNGIRSNIFHNLEEAIDWLSDKETIKVH